MVTLLIFRQTIDFTVSVRLRVNNTETENKSLRFSFLSPPPPDTPTERVNVKIYYGKSGCTITISNDTLGATDAEINVFVLSFYSFPKLFRTQTVISHLWLNFSHTNRYAIDNVSNAQRCTFARLNVELSVTMDTGGGRSQLKNDRVTFETRSDS